MSDGNAPMSVLTRARLNAAVSAILALLVAFGVFYAAWSAYTIRQRSAELAGQLVALGRGQADADRAAGATSDAARERLLRVEARLMGVELFATDAGGTVARSSAASPPASLPLARLARDEGDGARSGVLRTAARVPVLVVSAPGADGTRIVAVQGLREVRAARRGILYLGLAAVLVAAFAAVVLGGALARRLTAPLVRLESAAESVAAGAYGTQVAEEGDAEIASLARSFNRMSAQVAAVSNAQRAFVADVSHEIRTPLTSIRGFAEALLGGVVTDPAEQTRALGVIRDESVRIGEIASTLLALSELDAGAVRIAREPLDVAPLAEALAARFAQTAREASVALEVALEAAAGRPLGDPERLLQAASALIVNALAYTPAGGRVRVSGEATGGRWLLYVDDTGPGIPAEKRDAVFARFSRLDASRASASGGAGLGLAICARLVELMGGTVAAEESPLGGARFVIALPLADDRG